MNLQDQQPVTTDIDALMPAYAYYGLDLCLPPDLAEIESEWQEAQEWLTHVRLQLALEFCPKRRRELSAWAAEWERRVSELEGQWVMIVNGEAT